ncbi:MAG: universal stress protein [Candidatus Methanomethylophilaceae archaeon]|nr:universal stress protein [Candidatus Methanomethylophilaceae archaeon]
MSIILAYDGRSAAQRALDFAINYAEMSGLPLYIYSSIVSRDVIEREDEFAEVKKYMGEAEAKAKDAGIEVHSVIEPGPAAENILAAASRFGCDIIVVGRSDKTIIDRAVLGSVSQHVVNHAKCNVVLVH